MPTNLTASRTAVAIVAIGLGVMLGSPSASFARSCSFGHPHGEYRPDKRYGDVVTKVRVTGVSCTAAKRLLQRFYNYNRDNGRYRPVTLNRFRCKHKLRSAPELGWADGTCVRGSRSVRWVFVPYTG